MATGSVNAVPPIPGIRENPNCIDSTGELSLEKLPESMAVIGGGVIGLELACGWPEAVSCTTARYCSTRISPWCPERCAWTRPSSGPRAPNLYGAGSEISVSFCGRTWTCRLFGRILRLPFAGNGLVENALSAEELAKVEALKREKYDTWEWNFGRSPKYATTNKQYWDRGCLEITISVEKGRITDIGFFGDFLSVCPLDGLTADLKVLFLPRKRLARFLTGIPWRSASVGL